MIVVETDGRVGIVRLHRPKALNALCDQLMAELGAALLAFDADPGIGAIVLTGSERAFAAGADVREMQDRRYPEVLLHDFHRAVGDGAAGRQAGDRGGRRLCAGRRLRIGNDVRHRCLAPDTAVFGQPEINLGIVPGAGGTQRLVRAIGKSKAMEMILSGCDDGRRGGGARRAGGARGAGR